MEQVCLKWNNFPLNITRNIDELWKDESLVDVTICSEGQYIQAHKVILSASSPLFKGIFAVNPCQHPVIILQDVSYQDLMSIITFIYKGEINIEQYQLCGLLKAAKTLQIRGLSDSVSTVDSENVDMNKNQSTSAKKRKVITPPNIPSNAPSNVPIVLPNTKERNDETPLEDNSLSYDQNIVPKEEPITDDLMESNISVLASDEEDIKNEINMQETASLLLPMDSGGNNDSVWFTPSTDNQPSQCAAFPCPFCDRAYTCWGYRRRHIKALHGKLNQVTCRWCPNLCFTQDMWMDHIMTKHMLSQYDALQGIEILEEAIKVLHLKYDNPTYSLHKIKRTLTKE